ncbi:hypothetical protein N44_03783 [Microcystis aeruginosa NIES-44]|uniref:Uncharacterized protein n=1 Tax=Microcystis aeruginosa NIES-44 TaxID=449439 RepID=A0A0A1VZP7_MICAE|nr:hypothetical protein N44_03783 [Microcystis aeruginosa NIES-44]
MNIAAITFGNCLYSCREMGNREVGEWGSGGVGKWGISTKTPTP